MTVTLDLEGLERAVQHALEARNVDGLHVLGYGEISCVVAWPAADGPWACKRLPVFETEARLRSYEEVFSAYLDALEALGIAVHESHLEMVTTADGRLVAYVVQPALARDALAPARLRDASADDGGALLDRVMTHIGAASTPRVGIDGQLSNWALLDGRLLYLDVTTPLLRDEHGHDRLDTELFMATLPAPMRPIVRRFLLDGILDPYFTPRAAALDLLANLHKEDLAEWVPTGVALAKERLGVDLTVSEVARYYRRDARLWRTLQTLRRVDRTWQRKVRRRIYPFLLPPRIERRL